MVTYSELIKHNSYEDRLRLLILNDYNYNSPREGLDNFYKSYAWLSVRREVIKRDLGFDLGVIGVSIEGKVIVHHIDPVTPEDIINNHPKLLDMENLITVSLKTHNIIHYGEVETPIERRPGDTKLW